MSNDSEPGINPNTILVNRCRGELLRNAFADEEDDETAGEGDDSR
jgi:hypothetical protein